MNWKYVSNVIIKKQYWVLLGKIIKSSKMIVNTVSVINGEAGELKIMRELNVLLEKTSNKAKRKFLNEDK